MGLSLLKQGSAKVPAVEGCAGARAVELQFSSRYARFLKRGSDPNGIIPAQAGFYEGGLRLEGLRWRAG